MIFLLTDLDDDGNTDMMAVGNSYSQETLFGKYDASLGSVALGDGRLNWNVIEYRLSGFVAERDVKQIELIRSRDKTMILITQNNGPVKTFKLKTRD